MGTIQIILGIGVPTFLGIYFVFRGTGFEPTKWIMDAEPMIKVGASIALVYAGAL